ncbi:pyridoxamine 5'-phosphate oxidase family protein [Pararhizobium antarcticum]|uniref:General stress protein n=1 Tax=Pararhizobium antarcticum TaxID=1798805 RepID=A0A657LMG7_9HYPH|nr:pyridoxamine 5'-phosphate oxidase family protein [Pararhizobium antarcticum]OJF91271.1 general stress protein [Pararhizobium antarcticum]OJG01178.1 general stress protein [Rhizobium sp. 58]
MVDLSKTKNDPLQQLWDIVDDTRAGMLGVEGDLQHMQPMAPQLEKESNSLWFYTRSDSDLVKAVGTSARARFCLISKDHDYHTSLVGVISENKSREHIDKFWSPVVGAWFENGKDDPLLTMLQMKLDDAAIWASSNSTLRFGWEIAKANLTGKEPDLGVHTQIALPH